MLRQIITFAVAGALVALPAPASASQAELNFDFNAAPDGKSMSDPWTSGCFPSPAGRGCVDTTGKAALRAIDRGDGSAIHFPSSGSAVIEVSNDASLNPGSDDFTVTAEIRISKKQRKSGANIIQKGSYDKAQWKLQADSGVPSCRISGRAEGGGEKSAEAWASHAVADREWTTLRCVREGKRLTLFVNDKKVDSANNADIAINNSAPVTIGGKHSGAKNDQFRGDMDNTTFSVAKLPIATDFVRHGTHLGDFPDVKPDAVDVAGAQPTPDSWAPEVAGLPTSQSRHGDLARFVH